MWISAQYIAEKIRVNTAGINIHLRIFRNASKHLEAGWIVADERFLRANIIKSLKRLFISYIRIRTRYCYPNDRTSETENTAKAVCWSHRQVERLEDSVCYVILFIINNHVSSVRVRLSFAKLFSYIMNIRKQSHCSSNKHVRTTRNLRVPWKAACGIYNQQATNTLWMRTIKINIRIKIINNVWTQHQSMRRAYYKIWKLSSLLPSLSKLEYELPVASPFLKELLAHSYEYY